MQNQEPGLTVEGIVGGVPERWTGKGVVYWRDPSGYLKKLAKRCIDKYFPALTYVNVLFVWKRPFRSTDDYCPVPAFIRLLSKKDRDIFGYDVVFEVDPESFLALSRRDQRRAVYHLLRHVGVVMNEDMTPERDVYGRVQLVLEKHDLYIRSFKDEVRRFGTQAAYQRVVNFLGGVESPTPS